MSDRNVKHFMWAGWLLGAALVAVALMAAIWHALDDANVLTTGLAAAIERPLARSGDSAKLNTSEIRQDVPTSPAPAPRGNSSVPTRIRGRVAFADGLAIADADLEIEAQIDLRSPASCVGRGATSRDGSFLIGLDERVQPHDRVRIVVVSPASLGQDARLFLAGSDDPVCVTLPGCRLDVHVASQSGDCGAGARVFVHRLQPAAQARAPKPIVALADARGVAVVDLPEAMDVELWAEASDGSARSLRVVRNAQPGRQANEIHLQLSESHRQGAISVHLDIEPGVELPNAKILVRRLAPDRRFFDPIAIVHADRTIIPNLQVGEYEVSVGRLSSHAQLDLLDFGPAQRIRVVSEAENEVLHFRVRRSAGVTIELERSGDATPLRVELRDASVRGDWHTVRGPWMFRESALARAVSGADGAYGMQTALTGTGEYSIGGLDSGVYEMRAVEINSERVLSDFGPVELFYGRFSAIRQRL